MSISERSPPPASSNELTPLVGESSSKKKDDQPTPKIVLWLVAALLVLALGFLLEMPATHKAWKKMHSALRKKSHTNNKDASKFFFQSGKIGDTSRQDFGARKEEHLILFDDFSSSSSLQELWHSDVSLFGEGNGGFAYYTDHNVKVEEGDQQLKIRPGLFRDLGKLQTGVPNQVYDAADVMMGNCTPFPECSTFTVGKSFDHDSSPCTIADFSGCQRIGTPLVALNPVTSGRVSTRDTFHFTYGRLEARMRLAQGDYLWPAFWLMPNEAKYGVWPNSGEIDLMEAKGNAPGYIVNDKDSGRDVFVSSLHYAGNPWWHTQATAKASELFSSSSFDFADDFFTVGLYWTDTRMYAYVLVDNDETEHILWEANASSGFGPDDVPLGSRAAPLGRERDQNERTPVEGAGPYVNSTHKNAPFDQPFYIIFNMAVGGVQNGCPDPNYWGEHAIWCTEADKSRPEVAGSTVFWEHRDQWLPTWEHAKAAGRDAFTIDWVKVWQ